MHLPKLYFRAKYILFHLKKIKVKHFIVVITLLKFSYTFCFSFFPSFQCFSWISCHVKNFYYFLEKKIIKSHYRQLQVPIMTFPKKVLVIFLASWTQRTHYETFWVLYRKLLLINVSKTVCGIDLVFLWLRFIGKTIKILGFHNNTHLLDHSNIDMSSRGIFRTLWNI